MESDRSKDELTVSHLFGRIIIYLTQLNVRLQELESRNLSIREEARTLSDENKSLMTVIRLLNNKIVSIPRKKIPVAGLVICIISKVKVMANVERN